MENTIEEELKCKKNVRKMESKLEYERKLMQMKIIQTKTKIQQKDRTRQSSSKYQSIR